MDGAVRKLTPFSTTPCAARAEDEIDNVRTVAAAKVIKVFFIASPPATIVASEGRLCIE
ncbi:hypothetical protein D3C81_2233870 [compost metagenome]